MKKTDATFEVILQILENMRISHTWWENADSKFDFDLGMSRFLYPGSIIFYDYMQDHFDSLPCGTMEIFTNPLECTYLFLKKENEIPLSIGPFLTAEMNQEKLIAIMRMTRIPEWRYQDLYGYVDRIPTINLETHLPFFRFAADFFFDHEPWEETTYIDDKENVRELGKKALEESMDADVITHHKEVRARATSDVYHRYELENIFLESMRSGNEEQAMEKFREFSAYVQKDLPQRMPDRLRDRKDLLITFNTLLRRVAYDCQVSPVQIDALSNNHVLQIEKAKSNLDINHLYTLFIQEYCELIREYSTAGYSQPVQSALKYIHSHMQDTLTLSVLAEECGLNTSYLSDRFHTETGQTVTEYIRHFRIETACRLLINTPLSLNAIASETGFGDYNYFARSFRNETGVSPSDYRKSKTSPKRL